MKAVMKKIKRKKKNINFRNRVIKTERHTRSYVNAGRPSVRDPKSSCSLVSPEYVVFIFLTASFETGFKSVTDEES